MQHELIALVVLLVDLLKACDGFGLLISRANLVCTLHLQRSIASSGTFKLFKVGHLGLLEHILDEVFTIFGLFYRNLVRLSSYKRRFSASWQALSLAVEQISDLVNFNASWVESRSCHWLIWKSFHFFCLSFILKLCIWVDFVSVNQAASSTRLHALRLDQSCRI